MATKRTLRLPDELAQKCKDTGVTKLFGGLMKSGGMPDGYTWYKLQRVIATQTCHAFELDMIQRHFDGE